MVILRLKFWLCQPLLFPFFSMFVCIVLPIALCLMPYLLSRKEIFKLNMTRIVIPHQKKKKKWENGLSATWFLKVRVDLPLFCSNILHSLCSVQLFSLHHYFNSHYVCLNKCQVAPIFFLFHCLLKSGIIYSNYSYSSLEN